MRDPIIFQPHLQPAFLHRIVENGQRIAAFRTRRAARLFLETRQDIQESRKRRGASFLTLNLQIISEPIPYTYHHRSHQS